MTIDLNSANPYLKKIDGRNTNDPKQHIMIYRHFFSHWTLIQSYTNQKKTINNYQDTFEFTLSSMKLLILRQHQNNM